MEKKKAKSGIQEYTELSYSAWTFIIVLIKKSNSYLFTEDATYVSMKSEYDFYRTKQILPLSLT